MKPTRILFIGNSFTHRNDLPGMLTRLAAAASPAHRVETDRIIANGRALKTHWEHGEALAAIRGKKWDYVVLQEQSTLPLKNPARMHEYMTRFDAEIKSAGAKTALYMTWARKHEWPRQPDLANAYMTIAKKLNAELIPAGQAWQHAFTKHPEIILHDKDNSHPNLAGTYLAACVFFATLFRQSPVGVVTADGEKVDRVTPEQARVLQEMASETMQ